MSFQGLSRNQYPSITSLQCFEAAARHLSFTHAAKELHLTQSAVSKQVALLEDTLQTPLFRRLRKRLSLSPAGQLYLEQARKILLHIEQSTLQMLSYDHERELLSIAAHPSLGAHWLIPLLKHFHDLHPHIQIDMHDSLQPFSLAQKNIDVAFLFGHGNWENLECIKLFEEGMIPVCQPSLLGKKTIRQASQLARFGLIQCHSRPNAWELYFSDQNDPVEHSYHGPRFATWSACIQAALAGYGIALVPKFLAADALQQQLLVCPWEHELPSLGAYYVAYEAHTADEPRIRQLINWLTQHLKLKDHEKKE
ncbi:LysR family transcriptional regulator [Alcaligenaceae bacterium 429]|nr:LysR family transcriptional regulator [Alcaligenaceae bacterium 429]